MSLNFLLKDLLYYLLIYVSVWNIHAVPAKLELVKGAVSHLTWVLEIELPLEKQQALNHWAIFQPLSLCVNDSVFI